MKKAKTPDLYIIHGWTYTVAPWTKTLKTLDKRGLKVKMLHVPGLTASSKKVWTIEDYVKWADREIPDGAVALGHSNGGRILLNLCAEKPEKLKHLILLDAAGVYELSSKRDVARELSKKFRWLKAVPGLTQIWHRLTGAADYAKAPENMKKTLANMLESDKKLELNKVTVPTTILWGAEDVVTPPRQAEVMHTHIVGSTLEIFPGWTHAPYLSHPEQLARAIYSAYKKPPVVPKATEHVDAAEGSAALALKKAPEPVLEAPEQNPVVPSAATKLVLKKVTQKITKGLVVSDSEGAAVKYQAKIPTVPSKHSDAAASSAALVLKKGEKKPVAATAAKMPNVEKARPEEPERTFKESLVEAKEAMKPVIEQIISEKPAPEVDAVAELSEVSKEASQFVPMDLEMGPRLPQGAITSANVQPVGRIEKLKRIVKDNLAGVQPVVDAPVEEPAKKTKDKK